MRKQPKIRWALVLVIGLVVLNAGWMLFDGARALLVGDYVTPESGPHAGELGPWSAIVEVLDIEPRSTPMKWAFVIYGACFLVVVAAFLLRVPWTWKCMLGMAVLGLWYLPVGTLINAVVIVLLRRPDPRHHGEAPVE